jgi:molecular chaperone DnaJ
MTKSDYYTTLGVAKASSQDEIKKAYRKLAMQYHPDRNPNDKKAEAKFKEITEAYEVLKDDQKKAAYDRYGHDAFSQGGSSGGYQGFGGANSDDLSDLFSSVFGDMMGGGRRRKTKMKGNDLSYALKISLEEAFKGVEKQITFFNMVSCSSCKGHGSNDGQSKDCSYCHGQGAVRVQQGFFAVEQTCHKCQGQGQIISNPCVTCGGAGRKKDKIVKNITIPAGIQDEQRIKYSGDGEAGMRGGGAGDLYVAIEVAPHKFFTIDNIDLHCRVPISYTHAVLGGAIEVPVIEGGSVKVSIPAGTQNDTKLKLKAKGMPKIRSNNARGDMFVHVVIDVPQKISAKQRELLEALDKELAHEANNSESFLDKVKSLWSQS